MLERATSMGSTHAAVSMWFLLTICTGFWPAAGLRPSDHSWELAAAGSQLSRVPSQTEEVTHEDSSVTVKKPELEEAPIPSTDTNITAAKSKTQIAPELVSTDKSKKVIESTDNQVYGLDGSKLGPPPPKEDALENEMYSEDDSVSMSKSSQRDQYTAENEVYVQETDTPIEDASRRDSHVENEVYSDSPQPKGPPKRDAVDEPLTRKMESPPTPDHALTKEHSTLDKDDWDSSSDKERSKHKYYYYADELDKDEEWSEDTHSGHEHPTSKGDTQSSRREPSTERHTSDEDDWGSSSDKQHSKHKYYYYADELEKDEEWSEDTHSGHEQPITKDHHESSPKKPSTESHVSDEDERGPEPPPPKTDDDEDMSTKRKSDEHESESSSKHDDGMDLDDEDEKPPSGSSSGSKSTETAGTKTSSDLDKEAPEEPKRKSTSDKTSDFDEETPPERAPDKETPTQGSGRKSFDLDDDEAPVDKHKEAGTQPEKSSSSRKSFDLDEETPVDKHKEAGSESEKSSGGRKSFDLDDEEAPKDKREEAGTEPEKSSNSSRKSFDLDDEEAPKDKRHETGAEPETRSGSSSESVSSGTGSGFDLDEDDPEAERLREEANKGKRSFDSDDEEETGKSSSEEGIDLDDNVSKAEVAKSGTMDMGSSKERNEEGHCKHEGKNPDQVSFKVVVKNFYGVDVKTSSWNADIVLFYKWTDPRATEGMDFAGKSSTSMSLEEAEGKCIWMPSISVTNLAGADSMKTISQTVFVDKDGSVSVTERDLVGLKSRYDLTHYPFDSQELLVRVASTVLMAKDLTLKVEKADEHDATAQDQVGEQLKRQGWTLEEVSSRTLTETDGPLVKSRGEIKFRISRDWTSVGEVVFLPEVLVTVLPWSAFFSPMAPPFAMPRVVASLIPLLCMVGFMQKSASVLPHASGWTWLDVYEASCLVLIVMAFILNQLLMYVNHSLGYPPAAEKLQITYRYWYGSLLFVINALMFVCRKFSRMTELGALVAAIFLLYIIAAFFAAWSAVQQEKVEGQDGEEEGEAVSNNVQ